MTLYCQDGLWKSAAGSNAGGAFGGEFRRLESRWGTVSCQRANPRTGSCPAGFTMHRYSFTPGHFAGDVWKGSSGSPSGMIGYFDAVDCPSGWLAADGTNDMPDLRGMFVRGFGSQLVSHGAYGNTIHASGAIGAVQGDAIRNIQGQFNAAWEAAGLGAVATGAFSANQVSTGMNEVPGTNGWAGEMRWTFDASRVVPASPENRPINVAFLACIRS